MTDYDDLVAQATFPSPPPASPQPPPQQAFAPQSAPPPVAPPKPAVATPAPTPVAAPQPTQTAAPPPNPLQQLGIPDLSDKIAKARADGHSDDEIRSYIAQSKTFGPKFQEAQKMGIEPDQIFQQIGLGATPKQQQSAQAAGNSPYNTAALLRYPAEVRPLIQLAGENRLGRTLNPENQYDRGLLQAAIEYNPNLDLSKNGAAGSRESVYLSRQIASGNLGVEALKNIAELPITTTSGPFGSRQTEGGGLFQAGKEALTNSYLVPQVTQEYKAMLGGLSRNLAAIETQGLAPAGSLTHSLNSVEFQEGDPAIVHLRKLTEIRQIIEKGLEPIISNPRVPAEQKAGVASIIKQAQEAVPYTHHDLTTFEKNAKPYQSISDFAAQKGFGQSQQSAAPSGSQASSSPSAAPSLPQGFPPNARQAPDGNFYVPNPNGTGYLRVRPGG